MKRIDYEARAYSPDASIICYALNIGGVALSVFKPRKMEDRSPRPFTFDSDADFINFADKIVILAEQVKGRN